MKKLIFAFLMLTLVLLVAISGISGALDITQTVTDKNTDNFNYGKITLRDWFGLGSEIWVGEIKEHTESCSSDCSSMIEVNVKKGLPYYDSIKFYKLNTGKKIEKEIYSYKVEKRTKHTPVEYPIYNYVCSPTGKLSLNGTAEQSCSNVQTGTGTRYEDEWVEITDKSLSDGSTAYIRIVGEKKATDIIDWVITTQGESLESWAVWGSGGADIIGHGITLNQTGSNANILGIRINVTENMRLRNFSRWTSVTTPNASIRSSAGAVLSECTFVGDYCLVDYTLLKDTEYIIDMGGGGTWVYYQQQPVSLPIINGNLTWIVGTINQVNEASHLFNLKELYFEAGGIYLNSPANSLTTINQTILFNCSATPTSPATLVNISLWTNNTGWKLNSTVAVTGATGSATFMKTFPIGNYNWSCSACDSDGDCGVASENRTFSIVPTLVNSVSYNASAYETESQTYSINASGVFSTATLVYNGTSYAATISGEIASKSLTLPASSGNKSLYWELNGGVINSSTYHQNLLPINLTLCDYKIYNATYINFTFKDEATDGYITGQIPTSTFIYWLGDGSVNKTLTYINTSEYLNHAFCFSPSHKSVTIDNYIQYKNSTSYPQRVYDPSASIFSNITSNITLYLLSTTDGVYETIQVLSVASQPISGVTLTINRTIGTTPTTVGVGTTGSDGTSTFWLNPDFSHTLLAQKDGYSDVSVSFTPTGAGRTINLGSSATSTGYDFYRGINIDINPKDSYLYNGTTYTFNFTLTSDYWTIDSIDFTLRNASNYVLGGASNAGAGTITYDLNTGNQTLIFIDYAWTITGNQTNGTRSWIIIDAGDTGWSIKNFFNDFKNYTDDGMFGLTSFSVALIVYIIIFVSVGLVSWKFGVDSPAAITFMIFVLVMVFDVGLGLIDLPNKVWVIAHFPTIIVGIIAIALLIKEVQQ